MIIYALVLASIFLLPGNMIVYAIGLMFCPKDRVYELDMPQKCLISFLAWCFISSVLSSHWYMALCGWGLRCEGFVMWLILARCAYIYWSNHEDEKPLLYIGIFIMFLYPAMFLYHINPSSINTAGFVSVMIPMIIAMGWPECSIASLAIFPILVSGNRTCLVAILSSLIFVNMKRKWIVPVIVLLLGLLMMGRFSTLKLNSLGSGARANLILQAEDLMVDMPVTGYGLDTLCYYLKILDLSTWEKNSIPDKVHNIFYDVLLMTGWIGYVLFLFTLTSSLWIAFKHKTKRHIICASGIIGWILFGLLNPQGCAAHCLMMICVFGINRNHYYE